MYCLVTFVVSFKLEAELVRDLSESPRGLSTLLAALEPICVWDLARVALDEFSEFFSLRTC